MLYWNVEFQEEYKRLDALCRECFKSKEGVSEYIRQMENVPWNDRRFVPSWESDYKTLKHMRWLRNRLAHEVGSLNSQVCTQDDVAWIMAFHRKILEVCDPLAVVSKEQKQRSLNRQADSRPPMEATGNSNSQRREKKSFWAGFLAKIRNIWK